MWGVTAISVCSQDTSWASSHVVDILGMARLSAICVCVRGDFDDLTLLGQVRPPHGGCARPNNASISRKELIQLGTAGVPARVGAAGVHQFPFFVKAGEMSMVGRPASCCPPNPDSKLSPKAQTRVRWIRTKTKQGGNTKRTA